MNAYQTLIRLQDENKQKEHYFSACVNFMDDDLREEVHCYGKYENDEAFLYAYCMAHEAKFDEEFVVN